ncbi:MAG: AMIN domain-containing protein, partial [Gammaproteobacteria bacterium]
MIRTGWLLVCLVAAGVVNAAELSGLRGRVDHSGTRVVFDLSAPVKYKVFALTNPDRLVVDLNSTRADQPVSLPTTGVVQSVRAGKRDNGALRVVFDLNRQVKSKSFLLGPEGSAGHRLVLDLSSDNDSVVTARTLLDQPARPVTIVIDPGHGGIDPGALGKGGVHEKDVVLGISRELARLINRQPGMRAVLT